MLITETEDQHDDQDHGQREGAQADLGQDIAELHQIVLGMVSEGQPVSHHRRHDQRGGQGCHHRCCQEDPHERSLEPAESCLEWQGEEEAREDLDSGLADPKLLEEFGPVAVQTLGGGFVALGARIVGVLFLAQLDLLAVRQRLPVPGSTQWRRRGPGVRGSEPDQPADRECFGSG